MKIYDEIVIDMNPESDTFEQTLSEDSYEYSGDLYECGGVGKKIKRGWNKLTSAVGKVWNKTLGKEGLGKWLGKQKLFGTRLDKLARKVTPKFIRNMKSSDWASVLMSFMGPGAMLGKLGQTLNTFGSWGNKLNTFLEGTKHFKWLGKMGRGIQNIAAMPRSFAQNILGMGVNPNAMYGSGWLNTANQALAGAGDFAKFGKAMSGVYNPIGMGFKSLIGMGDVLTGNPGQTLGSGGVGAGTWKDVINPFSGGQFSGLGAEAFGNTVAGTKLAGLGDMMFAGSRLANFTTGGDSGRMGDRAFTGTDGTAGYKTGGFGTNMVNAAKEPMAASLQTAMNIPGAAAANAIKFAPALYDWNDTNPYSDWSNFALGAGEVGGHLYGGLTGQDEFKMSEFGEDTGLQPVDPDDPSKGVQFGQYPGSDMLAEGTLEAKEIMDSINAQAVEARESGAEDVSAIAGGYQTGLDSLRSALHSQTFGMGYDPNTIGEIASQPQEQLYDMVKSQALSRGGSAAADVRALKGQWDQLMHDPQVGVYDADWEGYNTEAPVWSGGQG